MKCCHKDRSGFCDTQTDFEKHSVGPWAVFVPPAASHPPPRLIGRTKKVGVDRAESPGPRVSFKKWELPVCGGTGVASFTAPRPRTSSSVPGLGSQEAREAGVMERTGIRERSVSGHPSSSLYLA